MFTQFSWLVDCLLETMRWQPDASCSREQLRDVVWSGESFFRPRAQPSEHEDLLSDCGFLILAGVMTHLARSDSPVHLPCLDFTVLPSFQRISVCFFGFFCCIQSGSTRLTFILPLPRIMEPGRKFLLILDNAPSHACRLACEHYKTVRHGTAEFQPPCSPDLSPLKFFF